MKGNKVIIIGAGLTGLTLAYQLEKKGVASLIIEARDRIGGRIHTLYAEGQPPMEMGATWLGKKHTALTRLLKELDIKIFEQRLGDRAIYEPISTSPPQLVQLPPNDEPSYRIAGGSQSLIQQLHDRLSISELKLGEAAHKIKEEGDQIVIHTDQGAYRGRVVVSTLPPNLFVNNVTVTPSLPQDLINIATATHTWMGESIKIGLTYEKPFWRTDKSSGTIFSNVGPIPEMYDHSNIEDTAYALKGFLNGAYHSVTKEQRLSMIMAQLKKYNLPDIEKHTSYHETVWKNESHTFSNYEDHVLPHQNNGHGIYRQPLLNGKLYIAGSETASQYPGYMDGAVRSAEYVFGVI